MLVHFWATVAEDLSVEFTAAAQGKPHPSSHGVLSSVSMAASTFLRQLFESDYPKLIRVFSDLISRLEKFGDPTSQGSSMYSGQREGKDANR